MNCKECGQTDPRRGAVLQVLRRAGGKASRGDGRCRRAHPAPAPQSKEKARPEAGGDPGCRPDPGRRRRSRCAHLEKQWADPGSDAPPAEVQAPAVTASISPRNSQVEVGSSLVLSTKLSDTAQTPKSVTWQSSDTTIATVSDGIVRGVAPGQVQITAKLALESGKSIEAETTVGLSAPAWSIRSRSHRRTSLCMSATPPAGNAAGPGAGSRRDGRAHRLDLG